MNLHHLHGSGKTPVFPVKHPQISHETPPKKGVFEAGGGDLRQTQTEPTANPLGFWVSRVRQTAGLFQHELKGLK